MLLIKLLFQTKAKIKKNAKLGIVFHKTIL